MKAKIRLLLPEMESSQKAWGGGGGFGWCEVDYSVNPVGSKSLYKLERVLHDGHEVELELIERLNPASIIDEVIAAKIHGKYAREVQQQPITKRTRKKKPEPPQPDPDQSEIPL